MNRLKKLLFAGGGAAMLLAGMALVSAPTAGAAQRQDVDECTFCSSYVQHCGIWNVYRTCYTKMSGPGTCPACTGCQKMNIDN